MRFEKNVRQPGDGVAAGGGFPRAKRIDAWVCEKEPRLHVFTDVELFEMKNRK
jgi:hypothetical protein